MRVSRPALLLLAAAITAAFSGDPAGHVHRGARGEPDRFHRHAHLGAHAHPAIAPAGRKPPAEAAGGTHAHEHARGHAHRGHRHTHDPEPAGGPGSSAEPNLGPARATPAAAPTDPAETAVAAPEPVESRQAPEPPATPDSGEPRDDGYYQPPTSPPIPAAAPSIEPASTVAAELPAPRAPPVDLVARHAPFRPRPPPA